MQLYSAQDRYGLDSPGTCTHNSEPCKQWVAVITEEASLPDANRPEVFFSGNMHGDEQVGPLTLINFLRYVLQWREDATAPAHAWVTRLLATRVIVVMPMTNSLGYDQVVREENGVDPNRDFPYDLHGSSCMQTITARAVNEVWREHAFQLAVTYHGGMQAIAYEWGAPNHPSPHDESPDDYAQRGVGLAMGAFAGEFDGDWYPVDRLNSLVYPVRGGMEDWGYASSWDTSYVSPCSPHSHGGYPVSKTTYDDGMLRAFNILVETSDAKRPSAHTMGTDAALLTPSGDGDGHVPRNMRIALLVTDLAQPYLEIVSVAGDDGGSTPAQRRLSRASLRGVPTRRGLGELQCSSEVATLGMSVAGAPFTERYIRTEMRPLANTSREDDSVSFGVSWDIGGALDVDSTSLVWSEWPKQEPISSVFAGERAAGAAMTEPPQWASIPELWQHFIAGNLDLGDASLGVEGVAVSDELSGHTKWKSSNGRDGPDLSQPFQPRFSQCIDLPCGASADDEGRVFIVAATAKVDAHWAAQGSPQPTVPPQSHVVNARTNEEWDKSVGGHRVRGRSYWVSAPIFVTVGELDCRLADSSGDGQSTAASGSAASGSDGGGSSDGSLAGDDDAQQGASSDSAASGMGDGEVSASTSTQGGSGSTVGSGSPDGGGGAVGSGSSVDSASMPTDGANVTVPVKSAVDASLCADIGGSEPHLPVDTTPLQSYAIVAAIAAAALFVVGGIVWVVRSHPRAAARMCGRGEAYFRVGAPVGATANGDGDAGGRHGSESASSDDEQEVELGVRSQNSS